MKPGPLLPVSTPIANAAPAERTSTPSASAAERKAAQEFEAIFLRKMLACMEKSSKVDGSSLSSSADAYSSMIVGALADAVAAAGGIGLSQSVLRSIEHSKVPTAPTQGSAARTVQGLRKGDK